jgi:hypothetical protein
MSDNDLIYDNNDNILNNTENSKNDKFSQTNDNKDKIIKELRKELQEKEQFINELQLQIQDYKYTIQCKEELETVFSSVKNENIVELEEKIKSMKKMVQELKDGIKDELNKNELKFKEKIDLLNKQYEEYLKKETNYISNIDNLKKQIQHFQIQINNYIKERISMNEIIIRQEEKLNIFIDRLNQLELLIKKKNKIIKENEIYSLELYKIVGEQKKEIEQLKNNRTIENNFQRFNIPNSVLNNGSIRKRIINSDNEEKIHISSLSDNFDNVNFLPQINNLSYNTVNYGDDLNNLTEKDNENNNKIEEFKNMVNKLINDINE